MTRGRRNPDPKNVSDIDLLSHREMLSAISEGAPSTVSVMQIGRICEAVVEQYRPLIPKNRRSEFDALVKSYIEDIIFYEGCAKGEALCLQWLNDRSAISNEFYEKYRDELRFIDQHYTSRMASVAVGLLNKIEERVRASGTGRGRKPGGVTRTAELDGKLLSAALSRLPPERLDHAALRLMVRHVVAEAVTRGSLGRLGETPEQAIDTHTKRVLRHAGRIAGTTPK
jgi:hypothetical protein